MSYSSFGETPGGTTLLGGGLTAAQKNAMWCPGGGSWTGAGCACPAGTKLSAPLASDKLEVVSRCIAIPKPVVVQQSISPAQPKVEDLPPPEPSFVEKNALLLIGGGVLLATVAAVAYKQKQKKAAAA